MFSNLKSLNIKKVYVVAYTNKSDLKMVPLE